MKGRCCVFQPFDNKGPYDRRFDDTIEPAIRAAGMEPYRVDRDHGVVIPIETLHEEVRSATLCLADISNNNPNVMYELGFAIASGKDVVIIRSNHSDDKFPFDIQHRHVIRYRSESASDFRDLQEQITGRINGLLNKQEKTQIITGSSPIKSTHGLEPNEITALALIMVNADGLESGVSAETLKDEMKEAGFTKLATQVALVRLVEQFGYVASFTDGTESGNHLWAAYRATREGRQWLVDNQNDLPMRVDEFER